MDGMNEPEIDELLATQGVDWVEEKHNATPRMTGQRKPAENTKLIAEHPYPYSEALRYERPERPVSIKKFTPIDEVIIKALTGIGLTEAVAREAIKSMRAAGVSFLAINP